MTPATSPLLEVTDLRVMYGEAVAVREVSFALDAGRAVAILGANGAGKSSLAAAIGGVVRPVGGRVVFDGRDMTGWPSHRIGRAGLAYVPEGRAVFPHLSVLDNLRMQLRHAVASGDRDAALERAFATFPVLGERRRQAAGTLSGGEQQMLGLARVLAAPPRLLVADELSLGLAPMMIDVVFDALARARAEGVSIVLIEQYVDRALGFAEDAVILRRGEVVWRGLAPEARDEALAGYLGESAVDGVF